MNDRRHLSRLFMFTCVVAAAVAVWSLTPAAGKVVAQRTATASEFNDSHFHLTNYVQQG